MSREIMDIHPENFQDITENDYYKKLQKQLKNKFSEKKSIANKEEARQDDVVEDSQRVKDKASLNRAAQASRMNVKDKAQISSHKWEQDDSGAFILTEDAEQESLTTVPKDDAKSIKKFLGIKIDLTEKVEGLQEQFTQSVLQARSSNLFLSKFAQFKLGMIGQLLSRLGFTVEDLEKLKKHAIEGGKTENVKSMQENIYNQELSNLIAGGGKKTKKAQMMFSEVQSQLIAQMTLLGNEDYWNNQRLMEEQISQCYKILEEFNTEKKALEYQVNMRGQSLVVEDLKKNGG